ncbi:MAG: hypothetical protein D6800_10550, partial [Candidatus Zixiibacteriota bacterium]
MSAVKRLFATVVILFLTTDSLSAVPAPEVNRAYRFTADSLYRHIAVLSADSLEGREVGEPGEMKAARYLIDVFRRAGVEPKGANGGYLQPFPFTKRIRPTENCRLSINGTVLRLGEEFRPLEQSASTTFDFPEVIPVNYGITVSDSAYDDYSGKDVAGKAVLIKRFAPEDTSRHINWDRYAIITEKIRNAIEHDVVGVFLYTPNNQDDTLVRRGIAHVTPKGIPIILLRRAALSKLGFD